MNVLLVSASQNASVAAVVNVKMKKTGLIMAILLGLTGFISAHVGDDDYAHHSMMDGFYGMMSGGYGWTGMIFGWFIGLLVIVALVLFIVWLIKQIQKK